MTLVEFINEMKTVECALNGVFEKPFVEYLWTKFKSESHPAWHRICEAMCHSEKQPRSLVAQDFFKARSEIANVEHARIKRIGQDQRGPNNPEALKKILEDYKQLIQTAPQKWVKEMAARFSKNIEEEQRN